MLGRYASQCVLKMFTAFNTLHTSKGDISDISYVNPGYRDRVQLSPTHTGGGGAFLHLYIDFVLLEGASLSLSPANKKQKHSLKLLCDGMHHQQGKEPGINYILAAEPPK